MDIKRLELFCRVVDLKNFTRAAESVRLSQPSVSEHIRLLEEAVGEKLLDRLGREVLATPAGEVLYRYARQIIRLRDEALQAIDQFRGELSGSLVVGASSIPGTYLLPQWIEPFKGKYPSIRTTVRIGDTEQVLAQLLDGEVELALVGARKKESRVNFVELLSDELVLAVPPGSPLARRGAIDIAELTEVPFILRELGSGTRSVMSEALATAGLDTDKLRVIAEMGNTEAVRQAVRAGVGVSILSRISIVDDLERGDLAVVGIKGVKILRHIWLATRHNRQLSPLAAAFESYLRSVAEVS